MLAGADVAGPDDAAGASDRRTFDTIAPPHRSPHWTKPEALGHVSTGGWLGVAESAWRDALRSSAQAPPDRGFIVRIKDIAEAAARKAAALDDLGEQEPGRGGSASPGCPVARCPTSFGPAAIGRDRTSSGCGSIEPLTSSVARWLSTPCQLSGTRSRRCRWSYTTSSTRCSSRRAANGRLHLMSPTHATRTSLRSRMTRDLNRTAAWSAIPRGGRTRLRTSSSSRPPRPHRLSPILSPSLWQLTTRPPRIRSGSQLPVEVGVSIFVRAGRTATDRQDPQVGGL